MNIDNYIESLLNSGMSIDTIGRELSCALNRKQKEIDEKEKQARAMEKHREGLIDNIFAAVDTNHFDYKTAASAATLALIDDEFITDTATAEDFFTYILNIFRIQPGGVSSAKEKVAANLKHEMPNKSKEEKKAETPLGKYDEDVKKIGEFLRALGLM